MQLEPHPSDQPLRGGRVRNVDLVVAETLLADRQQQLVDRGVRLDVQEERAAGHVELVAGHRDGRSAARLRHVREPRHAGGAAHLDRRHDGPDDGQRSDGDGEGAFIGPVLLIPHRVGHGVLAGLGRGAAQRAVAGVERQARRNLRTERVRQRAAAAGGGGQDEGSDLLVDRVGLRVVYGNRERRRPRPASARRSRALPAPRAQPTRAEQVARVSERSERRERADRGAFCQ